MHWKIKMTNDEIKSELDYLEKELQCQIDLYFWDRMKIEKLKEEMEENHIFVDAPFYVDHDKNKITLSAINRKIINSINGYCARRSSLITELRSKGAVMTGEGNEYIVYGDGTFESRLEIR